MKTDLQYLREARAILSDKSRWTRCKYARDADDHERSPLDQDAVKFCAFGALVRVTGDKERALGLRALLNVETDGFIRLADGTRWANIISINDQDDGYERVLAAYDRAIAKLGVL